MTHAKSILTLLCLPNIGKKTVNTIIENFDVRIGTTADELLEQLKSIKQIYSRIKIPTINQIESCALKADSIISSSSEVGIAIISILDLNYPIALKSIETPPVILYCKGNINVLESDQGIAVIGTRHPTEHGIKVARRLGQLLAQKGFTVIGGLAIGCDTAAHEGCLEVNGKTIAILPSGLDYIAPAKNKKLADNIVKNGGLLLSEYSIGTKPQKGFYVERDRLQSGLSKAVIVVESDITGGTMRTVEYAKEQARILACYRHPVQYQDLAQAQGPKLMMDQLGAVPIDSQESILELINKIDNMNRSLAEIKKKTSHIQTSLFD